MPNVGSVVSVKDSERLMAGLKQFDTFIDEVHVYTHVQYMYMYQHTCVYDKVNIM